MNEMPSFLIELRNDIVKEKHKQRLSSYFKNMELLKGAIAKGDVTKAKIYAHKSWAYIDNLILWDTLLSVTCLDEIRNIVFDMDLVNQEYDDLAMEIIRKKYPQLDANTSIPGKSELKIQSIPCIDEFGKLCAIMGEHEEIDKISQIVNYYNDLFPWIAAVDTLKKELIITRQILDFIEQKPGVLQKELKKYISGVDGRIISNICYYLDKYRKIKREKTGNTYSLAKLAD